MGLGRYQEAYRISRWAAIVTDSLTARDMQQKAMEYAEKFESQEKDHEIALGLRRVIILRIVVVFILVVLAVLIFFNRHIRGKNRDLQNVISSLEQKQKLLNEIIPTIQTTSLPISQTTSIPNTDLQDFLEMERIIDEQKKYLDPTVSIDMVMEHAGYNRRKSTLLIHQFSSTNTRLDYLNQKRVEYAAQLLLADCSLSAKEVGLRSGFYEDTTFRRNFKKFYGVTPNAYRALHKKNP